MVGQLGDRSNGGVGQWLLPACNGFERHLCLVVEWIDDDVGIPGDKRKIDTGLDEFA